jgi:hypothetical protein
MPQFTGGPSVRVSANTSIEVKWITDVAWFGKIEVFTNPDGTGAPVLTKQCLDGGLNPLAATNQSCTVPIGPVLQADTQYFVRVTASDPTQVSGDFGTLAPHPPVFSGAQVVTSVAAASVTTTGATIAWRANVPGFGKVSFSSPTQTSTVEDTNNLTDHALELVNLTAGTTYNYKVCNRHAIDGDELVSATGSFKTAEQQTTTTVHFSEPHAEPRVIPTGQTTSVSIRTKNQGQVIGGILVGFNVDPASAGGGTLSAASVTTDANGVATIQLTGNARGLVQISVSAPNATNSPFVIPVVIK